MNNVLDGLNERQAAAASHVEGPLLILAGAGSGKTKTLVHRIAFLIQRGVSPYEILALTFTNKAAKEMRQRIAELLGENHENRSFMPYMGTFHSICVRILRQDGEAVGIPRNFIIFDEADRQSLVKQVAKQLHISDKEFKPRMMSGLISSAKNELVTPAEYASRATLPNQKAAAQVFPEYEKALKEAGALDFDDLIGKTVNMLQKQPEIQAKWQRQFKHILVDEYQDTNGAQYKLVKLLLGETQNLCVVGDDWQCLPPGSQIETIKGLKPIEEIRRGDQVRAASGYGKTHFFPVLKKRKFTGRKELVHVTTTNGRTITCTPNHLLFGRWEKTDAYFVYLMYAKNKGYRIGMAKGTRFDGKKDDIGLRVRANQERADRMWILKVCQTREEAVYNEALLSYQYGIPMLVFHAFANRAMALSQQHIDAVYDAIDTKKRAKQLMADLDIQPSYPHFTPQATSRNGIKRINLNIVLFGDKRASARSPWSASRLSINTTDPSDLRVFESAGYRIRAGKSGTLRAERSSLDYGNIEQAFADLSLPPDTVEVNKYAFLTDKKFSFMPASHIHPGMMMPVVEAGAVTADQVASVERKSYEGSVYDLDVASVHNYIADGFVVHNSIYSWRGADFRNILNFETDFPTAKIIKLEENYRSTKNILDAAHLVITKNEQRSDKELWTKAGQGAPVQIIQVGSETHEADSIVQKIKAQVDIRVRGYQDFALLYRTNAQSRSLEDACIRYGLPYKVVGGMRFYDRKEIKDVLAYVRLAFQPNDQTSLLRIANVPTRGVGAKSLENFFAWMASQNLTLAEALAQVQTCPTVSGKPLKGLVELGNLISDLRAAKEEQHASEFIEFVARRVGYLEYLDDGTVQAGDRIENVKELFSAARQFDDLGLEGFLEEVALISDLDGLNQSAGAVTLMTLHAAKGLEFPVVFITGMEESIFPHSRALFEPSEMEEERRLCYVGMTRAREELYLYHASSRMIYGSTQHNPASRFLSEIDDSAAQSTFDSPAFGMPQQSQDITYDPPDIQVAIGSKVRHQLFGVGTVVGVEGEMISIAFSGKGVKKLNATFAPLEMLS